MKNIRISSALGMLLLATACVTINVYFPTAQAVEAADKIIRGVYGEEPEDQTAPAQTPAPETGSSLNIHDSRRPLLIGLLEWLVPAAQANADINIQSPAINRIRASMEARFPQLKPFYDNGSIGMTQDGLITVRDLNAVPLRDRKTASTLVADENRDRNALYKEIARANGHPEWESEIRSTFAKRWIANAPRGWWYQEGGAWKQK
ncbi:MAG: YdbL family protein [Gammaproteobacteria bacterium]|jgi:uncharacterized protein YdbL (DUF1318 family)